MSEGTATEPISHTRPRSFLVRVRERVTVTVTVRVRVRAGARVSRLLDARCHAGRQRQDLDLV